MQPHIHDLDWSGSGRIRSEAAWHISLLVSGSSAAGVPVAVVSGFRSHDTQVGRYNSYVSQYGQAVADTISARPGYSTSASPRHARIEPNTSGTRVSQELIPGAAVVPHPPPKLVPRLENPAGVGPKR